MGELTAMSVTSEGVKTESPPESRPVDFATAPHHAAARCTPDISPESFRSPAGSLLWELISRFLVDNALFLAAPSQIAVAIYNLAVTGQLWHHVGVSAPNSRSAMSSPAFSASRSGSPWRRAIR